MRDRNLEIGKRLNSWQSFPNGFDEVPYHDGFQVLGMRHLREVLDS
jgi:hypothetical protein